MHRLPLASSLRQGIRSEVVREEMSSPAATALSASAWWQNRLLMPFRSSVALTAAGSRWSGSSNLGALAGMTSTWTIYTYAAAQGRLLTGRCTAEADIGKTICMMQRVPGKCMTLMMCNLLFAHVAGIVTLPSEHYLGKAKCPTGVQLSQRDYCGWLTCCLYQLMVFRCSTKSGGDSGFSMVHGSWRRCSCGGRGAAPMRCVSPHRPRAVPA